MGSYIACECCYRYANVLRLFASLENHIFISDGHAQTTVLSISHDQSRWMGFQNARLLLTRLSLSHVNISTASGNLVQNPSFSKAESLMVLAVKIVMVASLW